MAHRVARMKVISFLRRSIWLPQSSEPLATRKERTPGFFISFNQVFYHYLAVYLFTGVGRSNGCTQVNLKYVVSACHANVYPGLSDRRWQKVHFSHREKKNVTEITWVLQVTLVQPDRRAPSANLHASFCWAKWKSYPIVSIMWEKQLPLPQARTRLHVGPGATYLLVQVDSLLFGSRGKCILHKVLLHR